MNQHITCDFFAEHLDAYLDSEVDRQTRQLMDQHAAQCPECGEKLETMTRLLTMCAELDEGLTVPLDVQAAWRKAVRSENTSVRHKGHAVARWVSGIAAALVLLAGGTFAYRLSDQLPAAAVFPKQMAMGMPASGDKNIYVNTAVAGGAVMDTMRLAADGAVVQEEADVSFDSGTTAAPVDTRQQIVLRTAERTLESTTFTQSLEGIQDLVNEYQGYFEQSVVDGQPVSEGGSGRSAELTVRIPSQDLDAFLTALDAVGTVTFKSESAEDISDQYYDVEARLESYRAQLQRLNEMMTTAKDLDDMLLLEDKRTEVLQQIDYLEGQLAGWSSRAQRSSVYISLRETENRNEVRPAGNGTLKERIKTAFYDSVNWLNGFIQDAAVVLAMAAPALVIVIPAIVLIWLIAGGIRRRKRRRKQR